MLSYTHPSDEEAIVEVFDPSGKLLRPDFDEVPEVFEPQAPEVYESTTDGVYVLSVKAFSFGPSTSSPLAYSLTVELEPANGRDP